MLKPLSATLAAITLIFALSALGSGQPADAADSSDKTYGPAVPVGNGTARSYVTSDTAGKPFTVGVELTAAALDGLPSGDIPGRYFPSLPVPENSSPYRFVMLDWNPHGHVPPGVYDSPHFDFHFYLTDQSTLAQIGYGDCPGKGEGVDCTTFDRAMTPVPSELVPPGYISVGAVVPEMGNHLLDVAGPEFSGTPFTHTWIYGSWDGSVTFAEPMITRAYLLTQPSTCVAIPQPAAYEFDGAYPTQYCMKYVAAANTYNVSLEGFVAHSDRSSLLAGRYRSELCRDADPNGLASWVQSSLSLFQTQAAIEVSTEGRRVAAVRGLYQSLLGRDPVPADCAGLRSWVDSSMSVDDISAGIMNSAEYKSRSR